MTGIDKMVNKVKNDKTLFLARSTGEGSWWDSSSVTTTVNQSSVRQFIDLSSRVHHRDASTREELQHEFDHKARMAHDAIGQCVEGIRASFRKRKKADGQYALSPDEKVEAYRVMMKALAGWCRATRSQQRYWVFEFRQNTIERWCAGSGINYQKSKSWLHEARRTVLEKILPSTGLCKPVGYSGSKHDKFDKLKYDKVAGIRVEKKDVLSLLAAIGEYTRNTGITMTSSTNELEVQHGLCINVPEDCMRDGNVLECHGMKLVLSDVSADNRMAIATDHSVGMVFRQMVFGVDAIPGHVLFRMRRPCYGVEASFESRDRESRKIRRDIRAANKADGKHGLKNIVKVAIQHENRKVYTFSTVVDVLRTMKGSEPVKAVLLEGKRVAVKDDVPTFEFKNESVRNVKRSSWDSNDLMSAKDALPEFSQWHHRNVGRGKGVNLRDICWSPVEGMDNAFEGEYSRSYSTRVFYRVGDARPIGNVREMLEGYNQQADHPVLSMTWYDNGVVALKLTCDSVSRSGRDGSREMRALVTQCFGTPPRIAVDSGYSVELGEELDSVYDRAILDSIEYKDKRAIGKVGLSRQFFTHVSNSVAGSVGTLNDVTRI